MGKKGATEIDDIFLGTGGGKSGKVDDTLKAVEQEVKDSKKEKGKKEKKKKKKKGKEETSASINAVDKETIKGTTEGKSGEEKEVKSSKVVIFQDPSLSVPHDAKGAGKRKRSFHATAGEDDGFADSRGNKSSRYTEDGLPIFDVKDLNIGQGGDTPQCPFDCDCCF